MLSTYQPIVSYAYGTVRYYILVHILYSFVSAWLQDDIPSHFNMVGYIVGRNIQNAELWMESSGVLAGMPFFKAVFNACGEYSIHWDDVAIEGKSFDIKDNKVKLATVTGPVSHLLRGERTAHNSML